MEVVLPFVGEGLSSDEPILVAVQRRHMENLRAALGGTPEGLTVYPVEDWYETSARTRDKFARWVLERTARAGRIRLIGEQPWALGHEAQVRDWARHESVINVAFARLPLTLICPYDASALPEEVLGHARDTHPEIVDGDSSSSSTYVDPRDFWGDSTRPWRLSATLPSLDLQFELDDLPVVRRLIGSFALDAGLTGARTEEIVAGRQRDRDQRGDPRSAAHNCPGLARKRRDHRRGDRWRRRHPGCSCRPAVAAPGGIRWPRPVAHPAALRRR